MNETDTLSCEEVFQRLDDYLDGELPPDEARLVEAHLPQCEACAREYRFEAQVIEEIRARLRAVSIPAPLLRQLDAIVEGRDR